MSLLREFIFFWMAYCF